MKTSLNRRVVCLFLLHPVDADEAEELVRRVVRWDTRTHDQRAHFNLKAECQMGSINLVGRRDAPARILLPSRG